VLTLTQQEHAPRKKSLSLQEAIEHVRKTARQGKKQIRQNDSIE